MNKTRKILSVVLAIMLIVSIVPVGSAFADNDGKWVSAWSTSPIDASLNDLGLLDQIGVPIALASSRVTIQSTATGSQIRLTFSNQYGNLPLTITAESAFVPFSLSFRCSPETIAPGQEAMLILETKAGDCPSGTYPLILKGSGARPSESRIMIKKSSEK